MAPSAAAPATGSSSTAKIDWHRALSAGHARTFRNRCGPITLRLYRSCQRKWLTVRSFIFGLPLIPSLPKNLSMRESPRRFWKSNSSGVVSIMHVLDSPERNSGCTKTFSWNCKLDERHRTRNSRSAWSTRAATPSGVWPQAVILTIPMLIIFDINRLSVKNN